MMAGTFIKLGDLEIGQRLLYRSRTDWRYAAVARKTEESTVLTICSPTGRTYRLRRALDAEIFFEGELPVLAFEASDDWRDSFAAYDQRW